VAQREVGYDTSLLTSHDSIAVINIERLPPREEVGVAEERTEASVGGISVYTGTNSNHGSWGTTHVRQIPSKPSP